jgi:hypothetical protein
MTVDVSYEFGHRYVLLLVGDHFPHARYLTLFRLLCLAQFASTDASVHAAKEPNVFVRKRASNLLLVI